MLTDEQKDAIGMALAPLYQQLERDVIGDCVRRLAQTGRLTETAEIMADALRTKGYSPAEIRREIMRAIHADAALQREIAENTRAYKRLVRQEIARVNAEAEKQSAALWEKAGNLAFHEDLSTWQGGAKPVRDSAFADMIAAMKKAAGGELKNLTKTMGFRLMDGSLTRAGQLYTQEMNRALVKLTSGAFSWRQCVKDVCRELGRSGLRTVDYATGAARQIDTAAFNALRTASAQLSAEITMHNVETTETALVEVSAHWGAREGEGHANHAGWQGKIYSVRGSTAKYPNLEEATGYPSDPRGLCGYNCRHTFYPFWEGSSEPTEFPAEPAPVTVNGKEYSYYQATQEQRRREREIRAMKREANALEAAGETDAAQELRSGIRGKTLEYRQFSKDAGIRAKDERLEVCEEISGISAAEKLQNGTKYGIITTDGSGVYRRILDESGNEKYRYLQTDEIQKLDSPQAIADHFRYRNEWGDMKAPIDASFSSLKLETQREAAEGIEWARKTYDLKTLPIKIQAARLGTGTMGEYRESSRTLSFRKGLKTEEAFSTAVHEMTHYADQISGLKAQEIVDQARKNLGMSVRSKSYSSQRQFIVGIGNDCDKDDPHELLAYALERYATNRANPLADEISKIWLERMKSQ